MDPFMEKDILTALAESYDFYIEELQAALRITQSVDELIEAIESTILEPYKQVREPKKRKELLLNYAKVVHQKQDKTVRSLVSSLFSACCCGCELEHSKIWLYSQAPEQYRKIVESQLAYLAAYLEGDGTLSEKEQVRKEPLWIALIPNCFALERSPLYSEPSTWCVLSEVEEGTLYTRS